MTDIGVAVNERRKDGDEWKNHATFLDVTVWNQQAEFISRYGRKGAKVLVRGKLAVDTWQDNSGQRRSKTKIVAEQIELLNNRGSEDQRPANESYGEEPQTHNEDSDDVPF